MERIAQEEGNDGPDRIGGKAFCKDVSKKLDGVIQEGSSAYNRMAENIAQWEENDLDDLIREAIS